MVALRPHIVRWISTALGVLAIVALSACGSSSSSKSTSSGSSATSDAGKPTLLAITISEAGNAAKYTVPAAATGGLVNVKLTNTGHAPHSAQLVRIVGNHTAQQALMAVGGNSNKTPSWVRGAGGVGGVNPGQTGSSTLNLDPGKYVIADVGSGPGNGPPAYTQLTVASGAPGALPATPTTVTAAAPSKDHYKWQITGSLTPGANTITFASKGKDALHLIAAVRYTGKHPLVQIVKALNSNGPPPSYVDQTTFSSTAVLDGGVSQVTQLRLSKPGTYVLFCPLHDRDGGKPHAAEGLLTSVTVK
jgi:hypothetical protein